MLVRPTGFYACPKETIYQDVFIYIKFYISVSRLDYTYQDLHTRKTRFQYSYVSRFTDSYQDPLASTSSLLPLTRIDNQILYRSSRTTFIHQDPHIYIEIVIGLYEVLSVE